MSKTEETVSRISMARRVFNTVVFVLIIFAATFLIVHFVGQRIAVEGRAMESTLQNGDNLIVNKVSYHFVDPQRFDIVIFPGYKAQENYYIRRVIGMPGETIQIDSGKIYINGVALQENYGNEDMKDAGRASEPITLGANEYFVLGDNRNNSKDSRDAMVGNIDKADIIGKASLRIWPLNKLGFVS